MATETPFQVRGGMHAPAVRRVTPAEVPIVDFGALYSPSPGGAQGHGAGDPRGLHRARLPLHRQPSVPAGGDRALAGRHAALLRPFPSPRRCATTISTGPITGATCPRAGSRPTIAWTAPATSRKQSRWRTTRRHIIPPPLTSFATRSLSRYNKDLYRSKSNPDQIVQHTNSLKDSHTNASHAVMNGVPVPVVSRMLGHSNGPHDAALRPSRRPGNRGCRRADRAMGRSQHGHGRVGGVVTELLHQILFVVKRGKVTPYWG